MGVVGLELGVQVDLAVDRVDEAVQALAGARVGAVGVDHQDIALPQPASRIRFPSNTSSGFSGSPLSATECTRGDVSSMNVDAPGCRHTKRTTVGGVEGRVAGGQIEPDPVACDAQQAGALLRLLPG